MAWRLSGRMYVGTCLGKKDMILFAMFFLVHARTSNPIQYDVSFHIWVSHMRAKLLQHGARRTSEPGLHRRISLTVLLSFHTWIQKDVFQSRLSNDLIFITKSQPRLTKPAGVVRSKIRSLYSMSIAAPCRWAWTGSCWQNNEHYAYFACHMQGLWCFPSKKKLMTLPLPLWKWLQKENGRISLPKAKSIVGDGAKNKKKGNHQYCLAPSNVPQSCSHRSLIKTDMGSGHGRPPFSRYIHKYIWQLANPYITIAGNDSKIIKFLNSEVQCCASFVHSISPAIRRW